jgi:iron complex outermembrane receptor protein
MRRFSLVLLATTSLAPIAAQAADTTAEAPVAEAAMETEAIVVVGKGEVRQAQTLSTRDLAVLAPGTSPLKAIENLPSVNFQSADPFGSYEWAQRVSIRGFNQNQLGFTLDGIPLGDASYGNLNGMHISRAAITENLASTRVTQGAGAVGTQATNNLGGTVEFASLDPVDHFAVDLGGTYGSFNAKRGFIRVNAGSANGLRTYVSYAYNGTDKWKGYGQQRQHMVNAKAVLPVGKTDLSAYASYSDRREVDYQDMSLEMLGRLGYNWDNLSNNYALAVKVADVAANNGYSGATATNPSAGTAWPSPMTSADDAYYSGGGLRKDTLLWLGSKSAIGSNFTLESKAYYHNNKGRGLWWTPYVNSPNGVPLSLRTTEYGINRNGFFANLSGDLGNHHVVFGGWWEHNGFNQARRYYAVASRSDAGQGLLDWPVNPFYTQWEFKFATETLQYHVQDTIKLDALTINLGWKGFNVVNKATPLISGGRASGRIAARDWFQPTIGAAYKMGQNSEVYAGFAQSTRAYQSATTSGPFSTTQVGFDYIKDKLKPESSDTYEAGYRYADSKINATLGAYLTNFHNRLLAVSTSVGILGTASTLANVGGVRSAGIEALINAKLGHGFTGTLSYSYNDSTYRNDVVTNTGTVVKTAGKTTVDAPKNLARAELAYDNKVVFGRLAVNYMSKRYFTYTNGLKTDSDGLGYVGGRTMVDATIGYRWDNSFTAKPVELQINATNLFDVKYISSIGTNGFGNMGDNQTFMVGAPRAVFATIKAGF